MRYLYGVFATVEGRQIWALGTVKRQALQLGRQIRGEVRVTSAGAFDGGRAFGIDAPTFRAVSDRIGDFRKGLNHGS